MSDRSEFMAEVLVNEATSTDQEQVVLEWFEELGISAQVRRPLSHRDPGTLGWLVLAALPVQAFLTALTGAFAEDVYGGLKKLVQRVSRRGGKAGDPVAPLVLQDSETGLRIVLDADLPDEAYEQLRQLDLGQIGEGPVRYDRASRRWTAQPDDSSRA
jgi:hypothetical protein